MWYQCTVWILNLVYELKIEITFRCIHIWTILILRAVYTYYSCIRDYISDPNYVLLTVLLFQILNIRSVIAYLDKICLFAIYIRWTCVLSHYNFMWHSNGSRLFPIFLIWIYYINLDVFSYDNLITCILSMSGFILHKLDDLDNQPGRPFYEQTMIMDKIEIKHT